MGRIISQLIFSVWIVYMVPKSSAFINVIERDFQALTQRATAHHILLPKSRDVALSLKQSIRNRANPPKGSDSEPMYIVDAFSLAAQKYSKDDVTASRGGLLGILAPQGYCRPEKLDAACFQMPVGHVCGPIESQYGYHLLLVTERTNSKSDRLDGGYSRISRGPDGVTTIFEENSSEDTEQVAQVALQQVGFWVAVSVAGFVLAGVAAEASDAIGALPSH